MCKKQWKHIIAILLNVITTALVAYSVYTMYATVGEAGGLAIFRYYTIDSNLLAAFACLVMLPFNLYMICRPDKKIPKLVGLLKYMATIAVTVTALVVFLFLVPTNDLESMIAGPNLLLHVVCPVLCLINLLFFERGMYFSFFGSIAGLLPVVVYGGFYYYYVVYLPKTYGIKGWSDFYGFLKFNDWYYMAIIIGVGTLLLSLVLWIICVPNYGEMRKEREERRAYADLEEIIREIRRGDTDIDDVDHSLYVPLSDVVHEIVKRREKRIEFLLGELKYYRGLEKEFRARIIQCEEAKIQVHQDRIDEIDHAEPINIYEDEESETQMVIDTDHAESSASDAPVAEETVAEETVAEEPTVDVTEEPTVDVTEEPTEAEESVEEEGVPAEEESCEESEEEELDDEEESDDEDEEEEEPEEEDEEEQ